MDKLVEEMTDVVLGVLREQKKVQVVSGEYRLPTSVGSAVRPLVENVVRICILMNEMKQLKPETADLILKYVKQTDSELSA